MSTALNQFQKTLVYEGTTTLAGWREDLAVLRLLDSRAEARRRSWFKVNVGLGLALLGCIVVGYANLETLPPGSYGVLIGIPAALLVVGIIRHAAVRRRDVENRRYELVGALLDVLAPDLDPDEPIALRMDLLPADHASKDRQRFESGGWHVTAYTDPWLGVRGRLRDGARFALTVREHLQNRTRWKRSSSGKYKQKSKSKQAASATLKLRLDDAQLAKLQQAAPPKQAIRLPPQTHVDGLELKDDAVLLHASTDGAWTVHRGDRGEPSAVEFLALMFLGVYRLLGEGEAKDARAP